MHDESASYCVSQLNNEGSFVEKMWMKQKQHGDGWNGGRRPPQPSVCIIGPLARAGPGAPLRECAVRTEYLLGDM